MKKKNVVFMVNKKNKVSPLFCTIFTLVLVTGLSLGSAKKLSAKALAPQFQSGARVTELGRNNACPRIIFNRFKIIGKVDLKSSSGDKRFRLRLQGVIQNVGASYSGYLGDVIIEELPQGSRAKKLRQLRIQKLQHNKKIIIGALSQPLSIATEFLPQYRLFLNVSKRVSPSCFNNKYLIKANKVGKLINRRAVKKAIRN